METKSPDQQNNTDVYAEFKTGGAPVQYRAEQAETYYEPSNSEYNLHDPVSTFQYVPESQYGGESNSVYASELQCSQYQADGQGQYHYQSDGELVYQSDINPEREDPAQYEAEGYVHFLPSR